VPWNDLKCDAGRKTSNDLRQRSQNDTAGIVCHGETKVPLALCRRERFSCPETCNTGQNLSQFVQKGGAPLQLARAVDDPSFSEDILAAGTHVASILIQSGKRRT